MACPRHRPSIVSGTARERIAMISSLQLPSREQIAGFIGRDGWIQRRANTAVELLSIVEEIVDALTLAHFSPKEVFGIRLALEEAGVNAIKHGHKGREDKTVSIRYCITLDEALFEVEDQG